MARTPHPSDTVAASSTTRLIVFSVIALCSGWIGLLVDNALGIPHSMEAPGTLIWIMTPLLTGAVLALENERQTYRLLSVANIYPSWESIQSDNYPLVVNIYAAYTKADNIYVQQVF